MYCAALPQRGLGIALKMDDGNTARACEVVMAALLESLVGALGDEERTLLASLSDVTLRNRRGVEVGRLLAHDSLRQGIGRARRAQNRTAATHCRLAAAVADQNRPTVSRAMRPPAAKPRYVPRPSGLMEFEPVESVDSARAALDELPGGHGRPAGQ